MDRPPVTDERHIDDFIDISQIAEFVDQAMITRIIKRLTDYTEIISETKLTSIINYTYNLSSDQIHAVIDFLAHLMAISKIFNIAQKGVRDLEHEYVSNIFSTPSSLENSSAYLSIRNAMEIRLTYQTQQFNMNMGIPNAAKSMPISTLRGQVKTYHSMATNSASSKVQHGFIAASLHDAYILLIHRVDFWNDKTYTKFFFNEDARENKSILLTTPQEKKSLTRINREVNNLINDFDNQRNDIVDRDFTTFPQEDEPEENLDKPEYHVGESQIVFKKKRPSAINFANDATMQTPFGMKYGAKINAILMEMSMVSTESFLDSKSVNTIAEILTGLFYSFKSNELSSENDTEQIIKAIDFILFLDMDMRIFSEKFLYRNRKESFPKFYQDNSLAIELFLLSIFQIYFKTRFAPVLKFIRTEEMLTFACAFIIKRIYFTFGDAITFFGFFLIKAILKVGKIQHATSEA